MFKLKNRYIPGLMMWLNGLSLAGRESRERTRFVTICDVRRNEIIVFHKEILERYKKENKLKLDKDKKPIEKDNNYLFNKPEDKESFAKEVEELYQEEFTIEVSEGNKAKLKTVKELTLNTDYKFGPKDSETPTEKMVATRLAAEYETWCQSFEELKI